MSCTRMTGLQRLARKNTGSCHQAGWHCACLTAGDFYSQHGFPVHCGNSVQIFNLVNSKLYFWTPQYWISIISKPKVTFKHLPIPLISLGFSPKWGDLFFLDCKIFNRVNEQKCSPLWIPWIVNIYIKRKRKILKGGEMYHLWSPTVLSFEQWLGPDAERRRTASFIK